MEIQALAYGRASGKSRLICRAAIFKKITEC